MHPLALMIDLERCTGCKSCEAACKQTNALGPHTYRNRVMWFDEHHDSQQQNSKNPLALEFLTVTCQQCERPACLRACPVVPKAISKDPDTGVVSIDNDRCTGCGECAISCPYGAIGYNHEKHHAVKCDLCAQRRKVGSGPACASVCPTQAIHFGYRDDLLEQAKQENRSLLEHDHFLQKPATLYLKRLEDDNLNRQEFQTKKHKKVIPHIMLDDRIRNNLQPKLSQITAKKTREKSHEKSQHIVAGGCHICFNACPVKFHLQGDTVTHVYGNEDDPIFKGRICPKSQMTINLYTNKNRLVKPRKRIGKRGEGKFIEISWKQALDEIAAKLSHIRKLYGSETLAIQAGSRTGVLNICGAVPLFAGLWGTANVAATEPFCDLAKSVSLEMTQGSTMLANIYTQDDIGSAKLYVYFGDNQAETRPVNFGMLNDWRLRNGGDLIVVDPRMTPTASKASQWLPITAGTDLALSLAMIHHIFSHNLEDTTFCKEWVLGWETWRDFIYTQGYTPEWASKITNISVQSIRHLAESIATADGCFIFVSRGINQHSNATQTNRSFMFLAAITGNWGRKGGGYFNVSSEPDWKLPIIPKDRMPLQKPSISKNPIGWLDAMLDQDIYAIRALITGNNPVAQWPNQEKVKKALANLELIVHMDVFPNETSMQADYVLPMASGIEKGGTTRFAEDRRIVWNDRFISPPGEAKSDHWFWIELGKYFHFDDVLKEEYKDPRILWDKVLCPATPAIRGITTKRLLSNKSRNVRIPLQSEDDVESGTLYLPGTTAFGQPEGKRFPTPSGKLEFYNADLEQKFVMMGLRALPEFYSEKEQLIDLPYLNVSNDKAVISPFFHTKNYAKYATITTPDQQIDKTKNATYVMELVTGRPPAPHFHSWTHYFWQAQEMWPELYCQIHPKKAKKLSITDGDYLKVETQSGMIIARAWIHAGIRKTTIYIPIGWDEKQPYHPAKTVNTLTSIRLDPISQQANLKSHVCKVSRHTSRFAKTWR